MPVTVNEEKVKMVKRSHYLKIQLEQTMRETDQVRHAKQRKILAELVKITLNVYGLKDQSTSF